MPFAVVRSKQERRFYSITASCPVLRAITCKLAMKTIAYNYLRLDKLSIGQYYPSQAGAI